MQQIETKLNELLVTKAPFQLPESARDLLVKALPWLTLVGGALTAWAVWSLYQLATFVNDFSGYYSELSRAYGVQPVTTSMGPLVWVSLGLLAVEAVLFFVAFPALKARKKSGWNLLFWVSLLNILYAVVYLFTNQQFGSFIFSLAGTVISLYLLFQIRAHYLPSAKVAAVKSTTPPATPKTGANTDAQ